MRKRCDLSLDQDLVEWYCERYNNVHSFSKIVGEVLQVLRESIENDMEVDLNELETRIGL